MSATGGTSGESGAAGDPGESGNAGESASGGNGGAPDTPARATFTVLERPGSPVPGVSVGLGTTLAVSDDAGKVSFEGLTPARPLIARFENADYAFSTRELTLRAGQELEADVWLVRRGRPIEFSAERGIARAEPGVRIAIPPNGVADAGGNAVSGEVSLRLALVPGTLDAMLAAPAPLIAREGGEDVLLRTLGMLEVTLWRGTEPLNLAAGTRAKLMLGIPAERWDEAPLGATVPSWSLDAETARWVPEGNGTIVADPGSPAERYWLAEAAHFSTYNADFGQATRTCVRVRVVDDGTGIPIPGTFVRLDGLSGTTSGTVESDGSECFEAPTGAHFIVTARKTGFYQVAPVEIDLPAERASCGSASCPVVTVRMKTDQCVSGVVQTSDGFAVAGATVTVRWATVTETGTLTATTDAEGRYCVPVPRGATVEARASKRTGNYRQHSELATVHTPSDPANCGDGNCTVVGTLYLMEACLRGRVENEANQPIEGATITAEYTVDGSSEQSTAESAGDGSFCLPVPKGVAAEIRAEKVTGTERRVSPWYDVQAADESQTCGISACVNTPDLVIDDPTCIEGNVQDASAFPVAGASVTGTLDASYHFEEVSAETDESGDYCLEVPTGATLAIRATRDADDLVQTTGETFAFAPTEGAECGSEECETAPQLQFGSLHCVSGRVVDETGAPWSDAELSIVRELPGEGRERVELTTNGAGSYCVGAYPGSLARIEAQRSSAGRTVRAETSVEVPTGAGAACGGACAMASDLVLPRNSCITGTTFTLAGPVAGYVGVSDARELTPARAAGDGGYCLDVPQGAPLTLDALWTDRHGVANIPAPSGAEVSCDTGGCNPGPNLSLGEHTCLSGVVNAPSGAPLANADVTAYYFDVGQQYQIGNGLVATTGVTASNGSYCLDVPADIAVTLVAKDPLTAGVGATRHVRSDASSNACGGTCTSAPDLELAAVTTCVRGRALLRRSTGLSAPFPFGAPIVALASDNRQSPSCDSPSRDEPDEWGDILASSSIGEDGTFCLELAGFPPSTASDPAEQNRVYLQLGDCDVFGSISDAACLEAAGRTTPPLLEPGTCSASCVDMGTLYIEGVRTDCTG